MPPKINNQPVSIIRPKMATVLIPIIGTSILVSHAWSEKAKEMMRRVGEKKVRAKREPRNPEAEYEGSLYRSTDGWIGTPALALKNSAVTACRYIEGMTMVEARGTIFVLPDGYDAQGNGLVAIEGDGPHMREDMVRVGMGAADLRYRGYWREWRAVVRVEINENVISQEQVANLFATAGVHCGIMEGRPTAPKTSMDWGRFRLAEDGEFGGIAEQAA